MKIIPEQPASNSEESHRCSLEELGAALVGVHNLGKVSDQEAIRWIESLHG